MKTRLCVRRHAKLRGRKDQDGQKEGPLSHIFKRKLVKIHDKIFFVGWVFTGEKYVYLEFLISFMPQALEKNAHALDLYNQLPDSSSESSSSSSSSEEPTGRPKQLPVEEDRTPSEPVDLGASTSESEEGKGKVYKEALRAPFLAWQVAELQKVAPGADLPEDLSKELTQKKWEQAARTVLQEVEPEPDFNVKFLTEQKVATDCQGQGPRPPARI